MPINAFMVASLVLRGQLPLRRPRLRRGLRPKAPAVRDLVFFFAAMLGLIASTVDAAAQKSVTVSEGSSASLTCVAEASTITIVSATYGVLTTPAQTCSATAAARAACDGRATCSINANNGICGDPAFGVVKQLNVVYQCPSTSTGTPTNSQNAAALQSSISKSAGATSGAVIGNAVESGIADGFAPIGMPAALGPTGGFIALSGEPQSEIASRTKEAFAALAYAGGNRAPVFKARPPVERQWNLWGDIRGTGWSASNPPGNDLKGSQVNLTAGLGRRLGSDTLVGVLGGYERFKYDVAALVGTLRGDGKTAGGYFAQRFGSLRYDASLAWSYMSYSATAGTASGAFTADRWLATMGLTGNRKLGVFSAQPSVKLYVLRERQKAWTDSLGTLQAARSFTSGRTALGAQVARPWALANGWTVAPYAGLYGDWRFSSDNALPTGSPVANIKDGWSARVTSGLSATASRGATVSLGGELGGLGSTYKIWSGNVTTAVPF